MTTLFDIGDEIKVTLKGKIKEYTISENGDCYIIDLTDVKPNGTRIYLDSVALKDAVKTNDEKCKSIDPFDLFTDLRQ